MSWGRHQPLLVNQAATLLMLTLTLVGGVGAALVATVLAIPMLVLIATGEVFQNACAHALGRRQV